MKLGDIYIAQSLQDTLFLIVNEFYSDEFFNEYTGSFDTYAKFAHDVYSHERPRSFISSASGIILITWRHIQLSCRKATEEEAFDFLLCKATSNLP